MTLPLYCEPAKSLFVATPCYDERIYYRTHQTILTCTIHAIQAGIPVITHATQGIATPEWAYNTIATVFMESDADRLMLVDYDVGIKSVNLDAFVRLAKARRPIVGGVYLMRADPPKYAAVFLENAEVDEDGLLEMKVIPAGFMMLDRCVFDHMPYQEYLDGGKLIKGYFHTAIRDRVPLTVDSVFCTDWRERGGKVFALPDLWLTHTGPKTWDINLGAEIAREQSQAVLDAA